ncbi:MAG TPA: hypothetical protein VGG56_07680 [Terracidiphilus sp.]|jgi:hypothetical protein
MLLRFFQARYSLPALMVFSGLLLPVTATAASCKTQSQMTAAERDALSSAARTMIGEVQNGDAQALRANTIPAVAADFSGIAASVDNLKPALQQAVVTVDSLYALDASTEAPGAAQTDFYCGSPVVVLNFSGLPPGTYALAIIHATGVPKPQQISLVLAQTTDHRWMLGGFFSKPMLQAGHDGLWYWVSARKYAEKNMNWDAWFYYRTAAEFLDPVDFLSSPNLEKLQHEEDRVHPPILPLTKPLTLDAHGTVFQVTAIDTTVTFGPLDLEIHYTPDAAQAAQLHDPPTARKQVVALMTALLALHPELQGAFHGIWAQADGGSGSLFSLELPMDQIVPGAQLPAISSNSVPR